MNTAIIVAAGSGQRIGGSTPKQFLEFAGKPVIIHTLEKFEACRCIDSIILVLSSEGQRRFEEQDLGGSFSKLQQVVCGADTRAGAVWNALRSIEASPRDLIGIHDGVRPFVSSHEISEVFTKAAATGAACLVAEVTDTIKAIYEGEITATVDRSALRRALTPQVFRYDIIRRAFENNGSLSDAVTDECYLVEQLGIKIAVVEGSSRNLKITRPEDLIIAEAYSLEASVSV
jgi:2-C-methyl-D-erythritol 4-phosphate cytidylyltransferase